MKMRFLSSIGLLLSLAAPVAGAMGAGELWTASAQAQITGDALMQSQRIGKLGTSAMRGNQDAFEQLGASQKQLVQDLDLLSRGGQYRGHNIAGPSATEQLALGNVRNAWAHTERAASLMQ